MISFPIYDDREVHTEGEGGEREAAVVAANAECEDDSCRFSLPFSPSKESRMFYKEGLSIVYPCLRSRDESSLGVRNECSAVAVCRTMHFQVSTFAFAFILLFSCTWWWGYPWLMPS